MLTASASHGRRGLLCLKISDKILRLSLTDSNVHLWSNDRGRGKGGPESLFDEVYVMCSLLVGGSSPQLHGPILVKGA